MLNFSLETLNHYIVGLAVFDELGIVKIAKLNTVALVWKMGDIGVFVFAQDDFTSVLEVFNVLISHFGSVKNSGEGVNRGVKAAVADIFHVDDLFNVLANIKGVIGFRVNFGAKVGDLFHKFFRHERIASGFGIVNFVICHSLNFTEFIEDNFAV
ncbi:hypothetical protein R84B8_01201 [Treponema sp. R8-4-B8]